MAVDAYIYFEVPDGIPKPKGESMDKYFKTKDAFEIKEFSFDVENAHSVGSATGGAAVGKVKFNEFTIKKTTDYASPIFFKNCVGGAHYSNVVVSIRKAGQTAAAQGGSLLRAGQSFLEYAFKTVYTTKIEWSGPSDEGPEESITFVFGSLSIRYRKQLADGSLDTAKRMGWSVVTNKSLTVADTDFSGG